MSRDTLRSTSPAWRAALANADSRRLRHCADMQQAYQLIPFIDVVGRPRRFRWGVWLPGIALVALLAYGALS